MGEKERTGRITVHLADLRDQLVEDGRNFSASQFLERRDQGRTTSTSVKVSEEFAKPNYGSQHLEQSATLTEWLKEKSVRNIPRDVTPDPGPVAIMYKTLLEDEETFIKEIDEYLQEKDQLDKRKKEMLFKKWRERVFEPIHSQIIDEMEGHAYKWLDQEKRALFERYLDYRNSKGFVFLDTSSAEEYDPLVLTRPVSPLQIATSRLKDPLISQQRDRNEEDQIVDACEYGLPVTTKQIKAIKHPLVPLGRHGTECSTWLAMELTTIDSRARTRSRQRMHTESNKSSIDFEKWNRESKDSDLADRELQFEHKRANDPEHVPLEMSMVS